MPQKSRLSLNILILLILALIAFAGNSLLNRAALSGNGTIDWASFTSIRIVSGALFLWALMTFKNRNLVFLCLYIVRRRDWRVNIICYRPIYLTRHWYRQRSYPITIAGLRAYNGLCRIGLIPTPKRWEYHVHYELCMGWLYGHDNRWYRMGYL